MISHVRAFHCADVFLEVHNASLRVANGIIDIIGEEDADSFIRIVKKIEKSGYSL